MAKKSAAKSVKTEAPKEDILDKVLVKDDIKKPSNPFEDEDEDDMFSSGTSGAVTPVRVEPDDELLEGGAPDDFGQSFLEKDKVEKDDNSPSDLDIDPDDSIGGVGGYQVIDTGDNKVISDLGDQIESLKEENTRLKQENESLKSKPAPGVSDLFDQLYQTLKEGRVVELLRAVQEDYLNLKYKSYSEAEKEEIRLVLKDAFRERFEGKIKAAKLIHKADKS